MSDETLTTLFQWGGVIIGACLVVLTVGVTVHMLGMAWQEWRR
jgi:hypothetical protein